MKSPHKSLAMAGVMLAGAGLLAGCAASGSSTDDDGRTKIVVAMDTGLEKPAQDAFDAQVAVFEKANPTIDVEPREYTWTGTTFSAELAGGTLPDVFTIPFTDGRSLIEQEQIADISALVEKLPYAEKFNPAVATNGEDSDGNMQAVPIAAYGQALHYNRALFEQAGLDPNSPPATWAEVRTAAKTIADKTGQAGYATMTQGNTGGWILTTLAYTLGGRGQEIDGDTVTATVDSAAYAESLEMLQKMRWEDNSMGGNFLYDWNSINQDFAAGKIGMYVSGGANYTSLVAQNAMDPAHYGETVLPLDGAEAGALGGGSLAVVSAKADPAAQQAAVDWIDFFYMSKLINKDDAVRDAETLAASDQPVGVPQVPVFDKATYDESQIWIKDYINVPIAQLAPYISQSFDQQIVPEPSVNTQGLYGALDPAVQAVLTDKDANIDELLGNANDAVQKIIDSE